MKIRSNTQARSVIIELEGDTEIRLFYSFFNHDAVSNALGLTNDQWEQFSGSMVQLYGEDFAMGAYDGQFEFVDRIWGDAARKWLAKKPGGYRGLTVDADPRWSKKLDEYRKRQHSTPTRRKPGPGRPRRSEARA